MWGFYLEETNTLTIQLVRVYYHSNTLSHLAVKWTLKSISFTHPLNLHENIFPEAWEQCGGKMPQGLGMPKLLGAQFSKALPGIQGSVDPTVSLQDRTIDRYFFPNVIWVLWFHLGLLPALRSPKDVYGSLRDLSDVEDFHSVRAREMLLCGGKIGLCSWSPLDGSSLQVKRVWGPQKTAQGLHTWCTLGSGRGCQTLR